MILFPLVSQKSDDFKFQRREMMRKISVIAALVILPIASFANNNVSKEVRQNKWDPRFFIEYDLNVYSEGPIDINLESAEGIEDIINISSFNRNSGLYMGADFNGVQIGVETTGSAGLKVKGTLPLFDWYVDPYFTAEVGVTTLDLDIDLSKIIGEDAPTFEVDDINLTYAFGLGVKYDINDKIYVKLGAKYDIKKYDFALKTEGLEEEITIDMSGMNVSFGIGYRF